MKRVYKFLITVFVLLCIAGVSAFADGTLGDISADDNASLIGPDDSENYKNFGFSYEEMLNNPDYFIKNDSDISIMSTNTITLNYSKISVEEGESFTLRATLSDSGASVTWSSNNSMITVDSSGRVTGLKAGSATITATCLFSDNTTKTATCTVYVYIANGVYYIKNKNSNLRLEVYNGLIHQNTNVIQYSNRSASLISGLRQMWKVYFLGNGRYSIRAYHKLNMGLNLTGTNADIIDLGNFDSMGYVPDRAEWNILWKSSTEYSIQNYGSSGKALCISGASTSSGASAITGTYANTNNYKWTFELISSPPVGVLLYDTVTGTPLTSGAVTKTVAVGSSRTLEDMDLSVSAYGVGTIVQNLLWETPTTNGSNYVSINRNTGEVTGVACGTVIIKGLRASDDGTKTFEYTLHILPFENGEYYIRNKEYNKYLQIDNNTSSNNYATQNADMEMWAFDGEDYQKWLLTSLENGYYKIISDKSGLALSVGTSEVGTLGAVLEQRTYTGVQTQQWKITQTSSGAYRIIPRASESTNSTITMSVATPSNSSNTNGTKITQNTYSSSYGEWEFAQIMWASRSSSIFLC